MGEFQSDRGIVITPDHQYELRAQYSNTTFSDSDAMAILYLYLGEKDFHYPSTNRLQARQVPPFERLKHFIRAALPG
jgi:hypothetical protein